MSYVVHYHCTKISHHFDHRRRRRCSNSMRQWHQREKKERKEEWPAVKEEISSAQITVLSPPTPLFNKTFLLHIVASLASIVCKLIHWTLPRVCPDPLSWGFLKGDQSRIGWTPSFKRKKTLISRFSIVQKEGLTLNLKKSMTSSFFSHANDLFK